MSDPVARVSGAIASVLTALEALIDVTASALAGADCGYLVAALRACAADIAAIARIADAAIAFVLREGQGGTWDTVMRLREKGRQVKVVALRAATEESASLAPCKAEDGEWWQVHPGRGSPPFDVCVAAGSRTRGFPRPTRPRSPA